jgi:hypothetical protein
MVEFYRRTTINPAGKEIMKYHVARVFGVCLCLSLTTANARADENDTKKAKDANVETLVVKIDGLELKLQKTWQKKAESARSMRKATYEVKPVKGETDKAELAVFNFPNQDIKQNVDRWVGQFQSKGRKSTTTKGKCSTGEYYLVDTSGIFKKPVPGTPPFQRKTTDAPGYRMLAVILPVKGKGMYFLKLTGPEKTVTAQAQAFRRSFGGKKKEESEFK